MNQERYSRQMLFKHIGQEGHRKIENQHGLIIGMGIGYALGRRVS